MEFSRKNTMSFFYCLPENKIILVKKVHPVWIEPHTFCDPLWCLLDSANLTLLVRLRLLRCSHSRASCVLCYKETVHWWLVRVTLVVALGFLPQNYGRWLGRINCYFAQKWMQIQWWGGENLMQSQAVGMQKVSDSLVLALVSYIWATWWNLYYLIFRNSHYLSLIPACSFSYRDGKNSSLQLNHLSPKVNWCTNGVKLKIPQLTPGSQKVQSSLFTELILRLPM